MYKTSIITVLFIAFSCNETTLISNKYGNFIELKKTELDINIDEQTLNSYNILSPFCYDEQDYIYASNHQTRTIDLINTRGNDISHITLESEGINGIPEEISGLYVSSPDSIWIATMTGIILIDSTGKVVNRYSLLDREESEMAFIMCNFSTCTSKIYYNKKRNSLFYLVMSVINNKSAFFVEELDLSNNRKKKYPLYFNTEKNLRNNYGWKQCPNVTFTDTQILYNLPIESNIYTINIESGQNNIFGGQSRFTANEVKKLKSPYDFEQGNRHICENVHFFELNYDPGNNVYYRLHFGKVSYDATLDFESLLSKKELYLMVFDNEFKVINETKLDNQKYNYRNCWGILSEGLFIAKSNFLNENVNFEQFQIDIFHLKQPQIVAQ